MAETNNETLMTARPASRQALLRGVEAHTNVALLEFQSPTAALVAEPIPVSARLTNLLLASMVLATIAVLAIFKVDRVVTATGQVAATAANIVVQPLETAIVRSIKVRPGQEVKQGDVLAELDPTFAAGDDKSTSAQAASLAAEVARLRAELAGETFLSDGTLYGTMQASMFQQRKQEFEFHTASLRAKVDSLAVKVAQADAAMKSASARLVGLRDVEQRRMELEKLLVGSHLNTLSARDARMQMEAQLADSQHMRESGLRDLQSAQADLDDYLHQWRSETSQNLAQQERALSDMQSQASKAQRRHELVELKAPQDGTVLAVSNVSIGSVMQSGEEFIRLVPVDAAVEVKAIISGNTAGFVHLGDPVTIKFDTYPYIQYGSAVGRVEVISADSFAAPPPPSTAMPTQPNVQASAPANMPTSSAVFVARLSITELHMRNLPTDFRVTPGMPVTADIEVGKRSILSAMFARAAPLAAEGLREP